MSISGKDIKTLWGLAAGRCSKPGCEQECVKFLSSEDPTVIGEMAHVIAKKPAGPRGIPEGGYDTYDNLILLCPTHHTEVDKAPEGTFPAGLLHEWKADHEEAVRKSLTVPSYSTLKDLCQAILRLLIENHAIWKQVGPDSEAASQNPLSNLNLPWDLRKLDSIVPNNSRISLLIERHKELIPIADYPVCVEFSTHATAFEQSAYTRTEDVPRFPIDFEDFIKKYART